MASVSIAPGENEQDGEIQKARKTLLELDENLKERIAAIPDDRQIQMADGKTLSAEEVRRLWDRVKFVITTKDFGRGYGGSFDYATGTSYILPGTVNGWDAHPTGGEFITLHELIHSCEHGEAVRQAMWKKYYDENKHDPEHEDKYRDTDLFSEVEEYCFFGARAIMRELGLAEFEGTFPHGYEYGDLTR